MGSVADLIFVLAVVAFFAVALAVVAACDRIASDDHGERDADIEPEGTP